MEGNPFDSYCDGWIKIRYFKDNEQCKRDEATRAELHVKRVFGPIFHFTNENSWSELDRLLLAFIDTFDAGKSAKSWEVRDILGIRA